ncbi:uncharacterized protein LOC109204283 [Oreochromis niloticus]|uniref:uncharacterized protein LOC109204283 n=1 Tax=Oreochromis niloticus TaxID=8128 RepID=UPI000905757A|nr:uncharacterized protein LOC109204283 [Oreochromis niloticus]CAI5662919.1 unnamed protein product [Mustela putorius furo]
MNGRGDESQNNRNGRQVNPENLPSGDQEPAYEPAYEAAYEPAYEAAYEPVGGFWGLLNSLHRALYNIYFSRLNELLDELEERYDVFDIDNLNDGNVNNVNINNINVRDNNANVDNNELHDDHNAVVVDIENDDSDEAFEDCEDVHQYIPEEDPQPGLSRRRPREMDEEDVEPNKRFRWSEEFSDDDSDFISACDTDSESSSDELFEDALEEFDNHETGGSRKRSREDFEEEEENSRVCKLRRCSDESTSTSDDN